VKGSGILGPESIELQKVSRKWYILTNTHGGKQLTHYHFWDSTYNVVCTINKGIMCHKCQKAVPEEVVTFYTFLSFTDEKYFRLDNLTHKYVHYEKHNPR